MIGLEDWLRPYLGEISTHVVSIVWTVLSVTVYVLLRVAMYRALTRSVESAERRYKVAKVANGFFIAILVLVLAEIWLVQGVGLAPFLGLLSAGVAWLLREPFLNVAGWMFIQTRHPFSLGDRVQVGEQVAGDVVDIGMFDFTLMEIGNWVSADQSTGRLVHVPNGVMFTQTVANYTEVFPFIWNELPVTITYESKWEEACKILTRIAEETSAVDAWEQESVKKRIERAEQYWIHFQHLSPIVWISKAPYGITLTMRYLTEARKRRSSESELWAKVFKAFEARDDIHLAYDTHRLVGLGDHHASREAVSDKAV